MNISKLINFVLTAALLLICSAFSFGQKLEPKERIIEPDHIISSTIMGKDYQLYISFPKSYSTKDTINYPVLYVLDGAYSFPQFQSSQLAMGLGNELEDVIIVGIGSGLSLGSWLMNRTYDYTPSADTLSNGVMEKQYGFPKGMIKSGGAAKFLDVIKKEIAPLVDKHYKTNTDRGITGHSLGGLFAAYCMINSDGYFTRFGINSPSLWWNTGEFLNQTISEIENKGNNQMGWDIPASKVFISVGELEGSRMVPTMVKLSTHLEEMKSGNIELEQFIFENETHLSVMSANMSRTLSVLYGKK